MKNNKRLALLGRLTKILGAIACFAVIAAFVGQFVAIDKHAFLGDALRIIYPRDGTLFPPEIIAPTIRWSATRGEAVVWNVCVDFNGKTGCISQKTLVPYWTPNQKQWEIIKQWSIAAPATITITGAKKFMPWRRVFQGKISIATSIDSVGAPIFYREVNLPFETAVKDPSRIRWRFGMVSSPAQPPVVLTNLPVCGNCHSFSKDGSILGMDVDYANDKGAYAITSVTPDIVLDKKKIITWDDFRKNDGDYTFGLLSQVSPDGRRVISTVKDISVFVPKPNLEFSQLFFPVKGILVVYDIAKRTFTALKGADDRNFVCSNPVWSPDGKTIAFIRSKAIYPKNKSKNILMAPEECREFLTGEKTFKYDVYTVPFNQGNGGAIAPLLGAANNGVSNYFPRYSPNGKWIVFCQAKSFSLLQPDSRLFIMPSQGGLARLMHCNTSRMNSWHSFSPNGKWMVFSSKANGPFTQLYLTHINDKGEDTPPVLLENFTSSDRAANIPEFVNAGPTAIKTIKEQFVDYYSYARIGANLEKYSDIGNAIASYVKSLELNANDAQVHYEVGKLLFDKGDSKEAEIHLNKAIALRSDFFAAYVSLGNVYAQRKNNEQALAYYHKALSINSNNKDVHFNMGLFFDNIKQVDSAIVHYKKALSIDAIYADAHNNLGIDLEETGQKIEARFHYEKALQFNPELKEAQENLRRVGR